MLKDHLKQSAELSSQWGKKLQLEKICYLAGLLHDLGKYSDEFQEYLKQAVIDPKSVVRGSVDHSTAGGQLLYEYCHQPNNNGFQFLLAEIVGNAIISHHSSKGLKDYLSAEGALRSVYLERVADKNLKEYEILKDNFFEDCCSETKFQKLLVDAEKELQKFYMKDSLAQVTPHETFFIVKFVYSCLLDADRTNTMLFEEEKSYERKDHLQLFEQYIERLEEKIATFQNATTKINQLRQEMSNQCKEFSKKATGIYSLSIPTGGGKTLASLRFALNHARKYKKDRIIYVVPFTTIIEQNSSEVRKVLRDNVNVLEHHSNVFTDSEEAMVETEMTEKEREEIEYKQALMRDNWDSTVIFTTMVQFLETIYSRGTRKPRRFHNLANAVIIFDEAQGVPTKCTYMFNEVLNFLKKYGGTTSVLCTATQPSLDYVKRALEKESDGEMISNLNEVEAAFRRVELVDVNSNKPYSLEELGVFCQKVLREKENLLVILNTKSAVLKLYQYIEEQGLNGVELFHLSTAMCPQHRKDTLKKIRQYLDEGKRILCLTTQLIEAGVDISFQSVIRSVAGLDSIAQAAGRCNRHGEQELGTVYLLNVSPELEKLDRLKEIEKGKEISLMLLKNVKSNSKTAEKSLLSNEVQRDYFVRYYTAFENVLKYPAGESDQKNSKQGTNLHLWDLLGKNQDAQEIYIQNENNPPLICSCSPETVAKYFNVIHSPTTSVLVPYKKGEEIIGDLNGQLKPEEVYPILKMAQQYTVNLFDYELDLLQKNGTISPLLNGEIYAVTDNSYDDNFGIDFMSLAPSDALLF
ncbi:CRISPR-associated helicase Cas3' [Enterococcus sp. AZ192]|uniref:CRISPR-associated helicase Cas3' n=1 Tax=unclassified Enterococcus TaxID=2608891 RepID=UPI003D2C61A9